MRKISYAIIAALVLTATPAHAQVRPVAQQVSQKPAETFEQMFRRLEVQATANEAYRVAQAVKRAAKRR